MSASTCVKCGASAVILGPNDLCYGCDLVNQLPPRVAKPGPCDACPWTQKGQPDITDELRQVARAGGWFCCHVHCGECHGAANYAASELRRAAKSEPATSHNQS